MTKVFSIAIKEKTKDEFNYSLYFTSLRRKVLRVVFENYSVIEGTDESAVLRTFSTAICREISRKTQIQEFLVQIIIERFLANLQNYRQFWKCWDIKWDHEKDRLFAKMRIYLHKLHRLAPVFDYRRARTNLKTLQTFLRREQFWPRISTQLAIVIYITDLNDKLHQKELRVQNIRILASSSAYAFYNIRKLLIKTGVLSINE